MEKRDAISAETCQKLIESMLKEIKAVIGPKEGHIEH